MKFSFITATCNVERFLPRMLASIFCQTYPKYEIIVQDGGSTDATLAILNKYSAKIHWASDPDTGVYDAWNKALDKATGDWALFLGADDCLLNESVLAYCQHYLSRLPEEILFAYGAVLEGQNGIVKNTVNRTVGEVYKTFSQTMGLPFPGTFVRVSAAKRHKFDTWYKIAGDFDFAARLLTPYNIARIPLLVAYMEKGGLSSNEKFTCLRLEERARVLYRRILPKAQDIITGCIQNNWNNDNTIENAE